MALRATAPEFVPFSLQYDSSSQQVKENRRKPAQRRRNGQRKQGAPDKLHHRSHERHKAPNDTTNGKQKNPRQSRRRRRKIYKKQYGRQEGISETLFPPLSSGLDAKKTKEATIPTNSKDWLVVAERAHEMEQEQVRMKAIELEQNASTDTVKLTTLIGRSSPETPAGPDVSRTVVEGIDPGESHKPDKEEYNRPQHYVNRNMDKLRNRWWELVKEKNLRDYEKRQLEEESSSLSASESSHESWEESLVETGVPLHEEPVQSVVDPLVLQACLESSFPLHRAILENDEKAVRLLLLQDDESWIGSFIELRQLGISGSSNDRTFESFSPLLLAVYLDKPQLVKILYHDSPAAAAGTDSHGRTALMLASEMGLEGCIHALLASCGFSLLDKDTLGGDTAIHYACRAGVPASVIKTLLLANTNRTTLLKTLSCKNDRDQTPLHVACEHGYAHVVEVFLTTCNSSLLAKLLQIRDDEKQTPLLAAIRSESADIVMSLLMWRSNDTGGKAKETGDLLDGDSCPLSCAAATGLVDMVLLLLEFMDPNAQETGPTLNLALESAVRSTADTRLDCIRVLVEAGANPCAACLNDDSRLPSSTALNISCTKGDVRGLVVLLDSWEYHLMTKRIARRQDPKLRRQPESYFAAIEAKENVERRDAMTSALVLSLFLGSCDHGMTPSLLDAALSLFHRGARLRDSDFDVLKSSMDAGRLVSHADSSSNDGCNAWYAACYRHPFPGGPQYSKCLNRDDRSPLSFWSQRLLFMPWMQTSIEDVKCAWMVIQVSSRQPDDKGRKSQDPQVLLVAEGEQFVVDVTLVSKKSAKLAAAIRFAAMDENDSDGPVEIQLEISARHCRWLLEHIYHGSIVSGWNLDPSQFALDLMELAFVAEEFLCPSLLQECEMRLLSNEPFQCYCWSCCFSVRYACDDSGGECMYRVQGPSSLLSAESILATLAVSDEIGRMDAMAGSCIKVLPASSANNQTDKLWAAIKDRNESSGAPPFAYAKDAAVQKCLCNFVAVTRSQAFLSQIESLESTVDCTYETGRSSLIKDTEQLLLRTCLDEMESPPEPLVGEDPRSVECASDEMTQERDDNTPK